LPDHDSRQLEMNILRQKCIPILASNLLRIYDLIKQDDEIFRLIIFLSDHRQQKLYSVGFLFLFFLFGCYLKFISLNFSYFPKKL